VVTAVTGFPFCTWHAYLPIL